MLSPKKTKYKKAQKGWVRGEASRGDKLNFGEYALVATECTWLNSWQIESARRAIIRKIKRTGKLWIRIFPDIPVSSKPIEVWMGKGKGSFDHWMCWVKSGRVLFELGGVPIDLVREAFKSGSIKLPIRTKIISWGVDCLRSKNKEII